MGDPSGRARDGRADLRQGQDGDPRAECREAVRSEDERGRVGRSSSTMLSLIETERRGAVEIVRMRRPEHGNRVTQPMAEQMIAALETARQSADVGACVLTGSGEAFCLGGDYWSAGKTSAGRHAFARAFIDMAQAMARLGKPLIAAVNGNAHAGGFSLMVACDLAVAAADATFGLPEATKGLFPF